MKIARCRRRESPTCSDVRSCSNLPRLVRHVVHPEVRVCRRKVTDNVTALDSGTRDRAVVRDTCQGRRTRE